MSQSSASSMATRCRGCHASAHGFEIMLQMDPMPLAGYFPASGEAALEAPLFPLTWVFCPRCTLLQVLEDIPDSILFSTYNYSSSSVAGLVQHFVDYAHFLSEEYGDRPIRLLEIGCNDGVLLRRLPKTWHLTGVDPSDVAANAARPDSSYAFYHSGFSSQFVASCQLQGRYDVITGSNCLAHIADLRDVFMGVHAALDDGGHFWLEVHDCESLLRTAQWDTIYHEHKVEWSEAAMIACIEPIGFTHRSTYRLPLHGGALRVCFEKSRSVIREVAKPARPDPRLRDLKAAYDNRYDSPAARRLRCAQSRGCSLAAFGASGRANVYLNQLSELRFCYIVDESPSRVWKYLPRIATPIVSLESFRAQPPDICLITAWNYKDHIMASNASYAGAWLTAFQDA